MSNISNDKIRLGISWSIFAFISFAFGFFYFVSPHCEDDTAFLEEIFRMGSNADGAHDLIKGWKESITFRYLDDNARLSNVVGELALLAPHWLGILPIVVSVVVGFWLMIKLTKIKWENPVQMAFIAVLFVFLPVWGDKMISLIFAYNYVIQIPLTLLSLLLFLSSQKFIPILAFSLGLLTGYWHESMPVFLLTGAFAVFIFHPKMIRYDRIWLLIGLFSGFCWLYFSPSWGVRSGIAAKYDLSFLTAIYYDSFFYTLVLTFICLFKKKFRYLLKSPFIICCIFGSAILLIPLLISGRQRAAWPGMIACCCAIAWLLFRMCPQFFSCKSIKGNICVGLLFAFTVLHMFLLDSYTLTLHKELSAVNEALIRDEQIEHKGLIFTDMTYSWEAPILTLRRPNHVAYLYWERDLNSRIKIYHPSTVRVKIIPSELKDFAPEKAKPIAGYSNLWNYKGEIVSTELSDTAIVGAHTHFGRWHEWTPILTESFQADNGETYVYLQIVRSMVSNYLGEPTRIDIPD